jgi:3-oxoacyl-[acyl-carrier-protein] synthase II
MGSKRVVITGIGVVAPNGIGKNDFWNSLLEGRSGISRVSRFDVSDLPTQIAGEIKVFNPEQYLDFPEIRDFGLQTQFGLVAAKLALDDARFFPKEAARVGSVIGTSNPTYDLIETEVERLSRKPDHTTIDPAILKSVDPFSTSSLVSSHLKLPGVSVGITTSCTSGLNAIGFAFSDIASGKHDVLISGSADSAISRYAFMSFCAANIMSKNNEHPQEASRPFDAHRDGGILSEGAGIIVLESLDHAINRGANIYAEIVGYSECALGVDHKKIRQSMATSMVMALSSGCVHPNEIDYICAHGPSDPLGDRIETEAIKDVFLDSAYLKPVSSIKAVTGNCQSASGPMQVIASCLAVRDGIIPPTWNYQFFDAFCDLDYLPNQTRRNDLRYVLINSHGFNGTDSSLVIRRYSTR